MLEKISTFPILEHIEQRGTSRYLYPGVVEVLVHDVHDEEAAQELVLDRFVTIQLEEVVEDVE